MENSAYSLNSVTSSWLSITTTSWVNIIFPILCGVGIFLLILPYLPNGPSEPQPGEGRHPRTHEKEQRTRNRSSMTAETVEALRDGQQEPDETPNSTHLLYSNLRKGPDKNEYRQFLYESPRTRHTRACLKKYHENGESSRLWGQHNNTAPARTRLQNYHYNDESTQLWYNHVNTGPARAGTSDNHQPVDQEPRAGTADAAPTDSLSDASTPGNLPLLVSTQSSECQAQSQLGSLPNDPPIKSSGKSLLPALSVLECLSWLLSLALWLWASTIWCFIATTARYKSPQKPKAQSGGAQHDTTSCSPLRNIKDKEYLSLKKHSSPKDCHVFQTLWSIFLLQEHLKNKLEAHLTKKNSQIKHGLFPVRVRRSWLTVFCNYNAAVETRNIPSSKGWKVHQAHQRGQVIKTTSAITPGSPLTVPSPEHEETTKALGRTTTEVCQRPSQALGTGKGSRMPSHTIPSRVQERPWQGEGVLSVRRGNPQGSLGFISEPKESVGPAPADHAQKVAVLQKNLEKKSLRGKKAMSEVDMKEATTVMVTTEATKQVKSKKGPAWDVILGPSVKARPQIANRNLTPFSSMFRNVTAQDPNEPYLATKVANQLKLKANGDSDQYSQCQAVKLIPEKSHTEVLLQDIATGMLLQDTCNNVLLQDWQTDVPLAADILACQRAQSDSLDKQGGGNTIQAFLDHIFHGKGSQKQQDPCTQKDEDQENLDSQILKPTDTQSDVSIVVREDSTTDMGKKCKTIPTRLTENLFTSPYVRKNSATVERTILKSEAMEKDESTVCERDVAMFDKRKDDRRAHKDGKTEFPGWRDSPTRENSSNLLMGQREDIFRRKHTRIMPENEPEMPGHMRERMRPFPHYVNFSKTGQELKDLGFASVISQSQGPVQSRQIENKEILAAHTITSVVEQILVDKLGLRHRASASGANQQSQKPQAPPGGSSSSQRNVTYPEQKHLSRDVLSYQQVPSQSHKYMINNKRSGDGILPPRELGSTAGHSQQISRDSGTSDQSPNLSTSHVKKNMPWSTRSLSSRIGQGKTTSPGSHSVHAGKAVFSYINTPHLF